MSTSISLYVYIYIFLYVGPPPSAAGLRWIVNKSVYVCIYIYIYVYTHTYHIYIYMIHTRAGTGARARSGQRRSRPGADRLQMGTVEHSFVCNYIAGPPTQPPWCRQLLPQRAPLSRMLVGWDRYRSARSEPVDCSAASIAAETADFRPVESIPTWCPSSSAQHARA